MPYFRFPLSFAGFAEAHTSLKKNSLDSTSSGLIFFFNMLKLKGKGNMA